MNSNILVVDDEQSNTILLSELLKKAGYGVMAANDGFKAIAACKVRTPDLLIVDLEMPLMSGVEVVNRLRSEDRTRNIAFIFLSERTAPKSEIDATNFDEDILFKPVEPKELLLRVKAALKHKALSDKLRQKEGELEELSLSGTSSTLQTSRYFQDFLRSQAKQCKRYKVPVSLVILTIDNHEEVSKRIGRQASDALIAQISTFLNVQLRDSDVASLTNLYEFSALLTVTDSSGAIEVAERLRNLLKQKVFQIGNQQVSVTASIGICQFSEKMDDEGKVLVSHARAALTQALQSGGDMTLMAE